MAVDTSPYGFVSMAERNGLAGIASVGYRHLSGYGLSLTIAGRLGVTSIGLTAACNRTGPMLCNSVHDDVRFTISTGLFGLTFAVTFIHGKRDEAIVEKTRTMFAEFRESVDQLVQDDGFEELRGDTH